MPSQDVNPSSAGRPNEARRTDHRRAAGHRSRGRRRAGRRGLRRRAGGGVDPGARRSRGAGGARRRRALLPARPARRGGRRGPARPGRGGTGAGEHAGLERRGAGEGARRHARPRAGELRLRDGVNLRGGFFLAQETARRMLAAPRGAYRSIVFVTSVSAAMVSIERAEYCISKAGRRDDGGAVRGAARAAWRRGVRGAARHHRDRHDRRGARQVRRADRRRAWCRRRAGASRRTSARRSCRWCAATWPSPPAR